MNGLVVLFLVLAVVGIVWASLRTSDKTDLALLLSAFSACFAAYAAWRVNWERPNVLLVRVIPPSPEIPTKREILLHNSGATGTYVFVRDIAVRCRADLRTEFSRVVKAVGPRSFVSVPVTLTGDRADGPLHVEVSYTFCRGARVISRVQKAIWEGHSDAERA